jgi:hypothetical protein
MSHRLIALLALTAAIGPAGVALAQDTLTTPPPEERTACIKEYGWLWQDATRKSWWIKHATGQLPSDTCKLVGDYSQAELKMIKYIEIRATECGIAPSSVDQMKEAHKKTEAFLERVCLDAKQWPEGRPVISDFGDPAYGHARTR